MGSSTIPFSLLIAGMGILANGVAAAIVPVAQDRSVDASATAILPGLMDTDSQSDSAPGFGLFDAMADPLAVANQGGTEVVVAQGVATQISSLGELGVSATGEASVGLTILPVTGASGEGEGTSLFELSFVVDAPSTYSLLGTVDTQAIVTGGAALPSLVNSVLFEDVDDGITLFQTLTTDEAFGIGGILDPGAYRLLASAGASADQVAAVTLARTVSGITSYQFDLRLVPVVIPESSTIAGALALVALCATGVWRSRRRGL
jgi:hypothetical protein